MARSTTLFCALLCSLLATASTTTAQRAAPASGAPASPVSRARAVDLLGARFDAGDALAFGVGYLHGHEHGALFWGYGLDAQLFSRSMRAVDAGMLSAVGRLIVGHAPPIGIEVATGVATDLERWQGAARVALFLSFSYDVEVGYSYQFPFAPCCETPTWLASHQLSLRGHIPLHVSEPPSNGAP